MVLISGRTIVALAFVLFVFSGLISPSLNPMSVAQTSAHAVRALTARGVVNVTSEQPAKETPGANNKTPGSPMHVVFIGDSVMRYLYLDLAARLHKLDDIGEAAGPKWPCTSGGPQRPTSASSDASLRLPQGSVDSDSDDVWRLCATPPPQMLYSADEESTACAGHENASMILPAGNFSSACKVKRKNFMKYFQKTVDHFSGHMVCDCTRDSNEIANRGAKTETPITIENRWYRHPSGQLHLSYFQLFGDTRLSSRSHFHVVHPSTGLPADARVELLTTKVDEKGNRINEDKQSQDATLHKQQSDFYYRQVTLLEFAQKFAPTIQPPPTHIVVNIGLWGFQDVARSIHQSMAAMRKIAPHVVWRSTSQPSPTSWQMAPAGSKRAWERLEHRRQRIDRMMRRYCALSTTTTTRELALTTTENSTTLQSHTRRPSPECYYYSLPPLPNSGRIMTESMFTDPMHPKSFAYEHWNRDVFLTSLAYGKGNVSLMLMLSEYIPLFSSKPNVLSKNRLRHCCPRFSFLFHMCFSNSFAW